MTDSSNPKPASGVSENRSRSLVKLQGRFARRHFWLGALGVLALWILMFIPLVEMSRPTGSGGEAMALLILIPLLWLHCALVVLRLHDLGWSGWWCLLLGPLPVLMFYESFAVYGRVEQSYEAQQWIKPYVLFMLLGGLVLFFGSFILLGCRRGMVGPNKYGPDPVESTGRT
jgi:uncharacterized membrane protein YhaH (DUF805 family)